MITLFLGVCFITPFAFSAEYTLPGSCPDVKIQEKFDYGKFAGIWYTVASYASDGRKTSDCATLEFTEDNLGFTLKETYIDLDQGNRTQKAYHARVDPTFDAMNKAQFIVSYEDNDKVLQFPFFVLSTDYENFAIAYTCKTLKKKARMHYVFSWILVRQNVKLEGEKLQQVESALSKYEELYEHRTSFVFEDFAPESCSFVKTFQTDFFSNNFW